MPAELLERIGLTVSSLYPPFLAVALEALADCKGSGALFFATRGYATYGEQTALWRQGRFGPGPIVTSAMGGQSAHNFGLALDVARDAQPDVPKLQPTWAREDYTLLGDACAQRGLVWGGTFSHFDGPHFQWPGYVTGRDMQPLRLAFAAGGLPRVFALLDRERARPEWQAAHPLLHAELLRLGF